MKHIGWKIAFATLMVPTGLLAWFLITGFIDFLLYPDPVFRLFAFVILIILLIPATILGILDYMVGKRAFAG